MDTPFELYRAHFREPSGKTILPYHPFCNRYQPLTALRALLEPRFRQSFAAVQASSGRAPLSLSEIVSNVTVSCELMLLWAALAKKMSDTTLTQASAQLAGFLSPLVAEDFLTLWTPEREYQEEEARLVAHLFKQAVGKTNAPCERPSLFEEVSVQPTEECLADPAIGYELFRSEGAALALTNSGSQTGLGAARIGDVYVPAFGPHGSPLSHPDRFGIGSGLDGWAPTIADKEVWFHVQGNVEPSCVKILVDSVGVKNSFAFVFYVKADECVVQGRSFKPRSLARFCKEADQIEFRGKASKVLFSLDASLKIEIIPLAADRAFWGASFLVAAWLPLCRATTAFNMVAK